MDIIDHSSAKWTENLTFRLAVFGADGTIMDEVVGREAPTPGRTLVTGHRLGLVVEANKEDMDRFTTILRAVNSPEQ